MTAYDTIALIFNPNSTGDAPGMAQGLKRQLADIGLEAVLTPTKHAGHAEELAYELACTHQCPLIISVSGDGGYHEVINGAIRAKIEDENRHPVVTVAAAGNANDHHRVVRDKSLVEIIRTHDPTPIDVIRLTVKNNSRHLRRYAHSYVGFGMTPGIAVELNRHRLNRFRELVIVLKAFWQYRPFTIEQEGIRRELDSLIFANINEMAKVIKLHHEPNLQDNRFEIIEFPHQGRLRLLAMLSKAALFGLKHQPSAQRYAFRALAAQPVQSDGEIEQLEKNSSIVIESIPRAIDSLF